MSSVAVPTVIRAIGGAPKNWMAIGSLAMLRTTLRSRSQCSGITMSSTISSAAASAQATVPITVRMGHSTGSVADATAITPVPITDANQLGPRTTRPSIGEDRNPPHRSNVLPIVQRGAAMTAQ